MLAYAVHENIDCADWMNRGYNQSGVYWIYHERNKFKVWCDMHPEHGIARIKIQARFDGSVDFYRNWEEYRTGFGDPKGEYWLGLENIHKLTHGRSMEIKLEAYSFQDEKNHAVYRNFWIEDEANYYRLHAGIFERGHDGDNWLFGDNMEFSTKDVERDISANMNCAVKYPSGWWHSACFYMNFNGVYRQTETAPSPAEGIVWSSWKKWDILLKRVFMAIRRLD